MITDSIAIDVKKAISDGLLSLFVSHSVDKVTDVAVDAISTVKAITVRIRFASFIVTP